MRKRIIFGLAGILVLAASCIREPQEPVLIGDDLALTAATEKPVESRTVVESGTQVFWEPGDEIAVFSGERRGKFVSNLSASTAIATFWGNLGEGAWTEGMDLWAVYPYSEEATFDGETITTVLPSEQLARAESFGKDMNLSVARSVTSTLQFYNVGGGVRFSVTEEGIKKVMFEGLNGEIISGKVRIGFGDDDLQTVLEVTEGSQFITLLPPSGQETFQKDTWYYIVAIPGTLEKGYKLRFYKDEDYARRISETAVTIKRSIFGSIEKADDGIDYEPTTTHYPETEEEWVKSVELTHSIGAIAGGLIDSLRRSNHLFEDAKETLQNIDGVLDVLIDSENEIVAIMQKDSMVVNYPNPRRFFHEPESLNRGENSFSFSNAVMPNRSSGETIHHSQSSETAKEKKALILIPCEMPGHDYYTNHNKYLRNCLIDLGYDPENIISKLGPNADISYFKGEELSKYDYVHITTHGDIGYYTYQKNSAPRREGTNLASATEYDDSWAVNNLASKEIKLDDIALMYCDHTFDNVKTSKFYVCMTAEFLNNAAFNNTCIIISACHSATTVNGIIGGTLLPEFINKRAGIASGYLISANGDYSEPYARFVTKLMSHGISFQDADRYIKNASWFDEYLFYSGVEERRIKLKKEKITLDEYELYLQEISHNNAFYYPPLEQTTSPYYLNRLRITLNDDVGYINGKARFLWEFDFIPFEEVFVYEDYSKFEEHTEVIPFTVQYEVHIDNSLVLTPTVRGDKGLDWESPEPGSHSWFVIARIMEGDTVIASYQSEEGYFTIYKVPEAKDLGLSVKWGSFNLGATKPEMPGYFFAWGETEPYYLRLVPAVWREGKEAGYDWASYKWCNGSSGSISKYNTNAMTQLELADDAVHAHLGDKWRIPTEDEWKELRLNCTFTWTNQDGVNGFLVTSNKPGYTNTHIFLPANGLVEKTSWSGAGESGLYWSSCNSTSEKEKAGGVTFESGSSDLTHIWIDRCYGIGIRPVYGDQMPPTTGDIEGTEEDPWN